MQGSERERTERGVCRKHTVTSRTCRTERGVCGKHTGTSRIEPRHLRVCVVVRVSMSVRSLTCVCVRACVCGRGERDRDIPEAREAGELGRRQARQPVGVQPELPVVNTHEQRASARACMSADARVSRAVCDRFQRVRESERENRESKVSVGNTQSRRELVGQREGASVCAGVHASSGSEDEGGRQRTTSADSR